ncbi:class I SAM-dependent methyltransferase [Streptomyces sp. NPDC059373]
MSAFSGTVLNYAAFRPGIPEDVVRVLDGAVPSTSPRRLLDIGTGPGFVVKALMPHFDDIIALDPEPDMLVAAEHLLRPVLPAQSRLLLQHGTAEDFTASPGWQADLVTICRAFHWLDQAAVLSRLDQQVTPHGAVAVLSDHSLWTARTPWQQAIRALIQEFLGEQRRAGTAVFNPPSTPYEQVLAASAFSQVRTYRIPVVRAWVVATVLGYLASTSFAKPSLFGDRLPQFEQAATNLLTDYATDGVLIEDNTFTVLIAHRPRCSGRRRPR